MSSPLATDQQQPPGRHTHQMCRQWNSVSVGSTTSATKPTQSTSAERPPHGSHSCRGGGHSCEQSGRQAGWQVEPGHAYRQAGRQGQGSQLAVIPPPSPPSHLAACLSRCPPRMIHCMSCILD